MIQHAFDQSFVTFFNHFFIMHRIALLTKNHQIIRMTESNCFPQKQLTFIMRAICSQKISLGTD